MKKIVLWAALFAVVGLLLNGCGDGKSSTNFKLLLADAPLDGVKGIYVDIARIDLVRDLPDVETEDPAAGDSVTVYQNDGTKPPINLLDLANKPTSDLLVLANLTVPAGHYDGILLVLGANNTVQLNNDDTNPLELKVPSNKLHIHCPIDIGENVMETALIDFDLGAPGSFATPTNGHGYMLKPVLRMVNTSTTGNLTGTIAFAEGWSYPATATISITGPDNTVYQTTLDVTADTPGIFYLHGIPAGDYTATVTVSDGTNTATLSPTATVKAGFQTNLGTITVPAPTPAPEP